MTPRRIPAPFPRLDKPPVPTTTLWPGDPDLRRGRDHNQDPTTLKVWPTPTSPAHFWRHADAFDSYVGGRARPAPPATEPLTLGATSTADAARSMSSTVRWGAATSGKLGTANGRRDEVFGPAVAGEPDQADAEHVSTADHVSRSTRWSAADWVISVASSQW